MSECQWVSVWGPRLQWQRSPEAARYQVQLRQDALGLCLRAAGCHRIAGVKRWAGKMQGQPQEESDITSDRSGISVPVFHKQNYVSI